MPLGSTITSTRLRLAGYRWNALPGTAPPTKGPTGWITGTAYTLMGPHGLEVARYFPWSGKFSVWLRGLRQGHVGTEDEAREYLERRVAAQEGLV